MTPGSERRPPKRSSVLKPSKEELAQALREYPTWGHAMVAAQRERDEARRLLLSIEGAILGYWTDMPESVLEQFRVQIRGLLGGWEPTQATAKRSHQEDPVVVDEAGRE